MPLMRACSHPGCRGYALPHAGRCLAHLRDYDRSVRSAIPELREAQRIRSSSQWSRVRGDYRTQHPLCCDPFGRHGDEPERMSDVHHVEPLGRRPDLAYDYANLRSLCSQCHSEVEAMERSGQTTQHLFLTPSTP